MKERYKYAYLWSSPGDSKQRSSKAAWESGSRYFTYDDHIYRYDLDISYSYNHVYCGPNKLTFDDGGNVRDWKKLLNELDQPKDPD